MSSSVGGGHGFSSDGRRVVLPSVRPRSGLGRPFTHPGDVFATRRPAAEPPAAENRVAPAAPSAAARDAFLRQHAQLFLAASAELRPFRRSKRFSAVVARVTSELPHEVASTIRLNHPSAAYSSPRTYVYARVSFESLHFAAHCSRSTMTRDPPTTTSVRRPRT